MHALSRYLLNLHITVETSLCLSCSSYWKERNSASCALSDSSLCLFLFSVVLLLSAALLFFPSSVSFLLAAKASLLACASASFASLLCFLFFLSYFPSFFSHLFLFLLSYDAYRYHGHPSQHFAPNLVLSFFGNVIPNLFLQLCSLTAFLHNSTDEKSCPTSNLGSFKFVSVNYG